MNTENTIGPYRIDGLIGQGGMAAVYRAWHTGLHRHEALKLLPPQMTLDHSFVERFLTEARTAARLHHPHIATIHTVSEAQAPQPYFTMELVEGGDLADLLQRRDRLSLPEALPILRQVAAALDYAHAQGVIHRDVKPANVLLQEDGHQGWIVKIVDFGIARAHEGGGARLTKAGMIVGTPEYMAPEQGGSGESVGPPSDQYSLAAVAYEMLCGQPPFPMGADGTAMTVILRHLRDAPPPPPGLTGVAGQSLLRALAKSPLDRFGSCTQFVEALTSGKAAAGGPTPRPAARLGSKGAGRGAGMALSAAAVLGLALIVGGIAESRHRTPLETTVPPSRSTQPPTIRDPDIARAQPDPDIARAQAEAAKSGSHIDHVVDELTRILARVKKNQMTEGEVLQEKTKLKPELDEALQEAQSAITLRPQTSDAWLNKGRALFYLGQYEQARQCVKEARQRFGDEDQLMRLEDRIERFLETPTH